MTTTISPAPATTCWQAQPHQVVPEHNKPRPCSFADRREYLAAVREYEAQRRIDLAHRAAHAATSVWAMLLGSPDSA